MESILAEHLGIDETAISYRLNAIGLTAEDRLRLKRLTTTITSGADAFTARLYDRFRTQPDLASFLLSDARVESLRRVQHAYLHDLFHAAIDMDYVRSRLRIGIIHHRIQLTPPWFIATYSHFLCDHVPQIFAQSDGPGDAIETVIALLKSIMFDATLVLQSYGFSTERDLMAARAMSSPAETAKSPRGRREAVVGGSDIPLLKVKIHKDLPRRVLEFIDLPGGACPVVKAVAPDIAAAVPGVLEGFYDWIETTPALKAFFAEADFERLKRQTAAYWAELLHGQYDTAYVASRLRIGLVHERVGLNADWYMAGLARQASGILRAVIAAGHGAGAVQAILRAVCFDMAIIIDAYLEARVEALQRTEHFADQLVRNMSSGVLVIDEAGRIQSANSAIMGMFGLEPGLIYRVPVDQVLGLPDLTGLATAKAPAPGIRTAGIVAAGARRFRVEVMALNMMDSAPSRQRALIIDDITEVLDLAEQVSRVSAEVDTIIASARAIVWELDLAQGMISSMSRATGELLGYRDTDLLGRWTNWLDLVHREDRAAFIELCCGLAPGQRSEQEHRMVRADGRPIFARTTCFRPADSEDHSRILGLTIDLTALRAAEQRELRAVGQAERMSAVGALAAGLAHDFNNALSVITANLGHALDHIDDAAGRDHVERAILSAEAGSDLTRQLLSLAGNNSSALQPVSPNLHIARLSELIAHALGDAVILDCQLADEVSDIEVSPTELDSALVNLCLNARDAMPGGGCVTISTRLRGPHLRLGDRAWVEIEIADTGTGMPREVLDQAENPFFSTKPTGTGLGLYMVRKFVEGCHGRMSMDSSPGRGTSIRLQFPLAGSHPAKTGAGRTRDEAELPQGNGEIVLFVESDFAILRETGEALQRLGYAVVPARDAGEALATIAETPPDCVVINHSLHVSEAACAQLASDIRSRAAAVEVLHTSTRPTDDRPPLAGHFYLGQPVEIEHLALGLAARLQSGAGLRTASPTNV